MNGAIYLVGFLIVVVGILYMAHLMHIPQSYTIGIGIILVGMGVIGALKNSGSKGA